MFYANAAEMLIDANHYLAEMEGYASPSAIAKAKDAIDVTEANEMALAAENLIMDGVGNA